MAVWPNCDEAMSSRRGMEQTGQIDAIQIGIIQRELEEKPTLRVVEDVFGLAEQVTLAGKLHVVEPSGSFAAG